MKRIIYTNPDTGLLILVTPAYGDPSRPDDESEDAFLSRVIKGSVPEGIAYRVIDEGELPGDRYFRNQWRDTGTTVVVNMDKARIHHMGVIRAARDRELESLDVSFMRAVETGNTGDQRLITGRKQVLRDIPQVFDLSSRNDSPERLKQRWPENLERREG
jgi:hypothetical protein